MSSESAGRGNKVQCLEGIVDGKHVVVLFTGDWEPCHLLVELPEYGITVLDDTFPNLRMLSASLACELLFGNAVDFLHDNKVPKESMLWDLNHNGWVPDLRSLEAENTGSTSPSGLTP